MEELNFYHVQIGTYSKKLNFIAHNSFVCKSNRNQSDVLAFYKKQYAGFEVLLSTPIDVELEIDNRLVIGLQNEITFLQNEIIDLKNRAKPVRLFKGKLNKRDLNEENKALLEILVEKERELYSTIRTLREGIRSQLEERYTAFASRIDISNTIKSNNDVDAEYTVYLDGELS